MYGQNIAMYRHHHLTARSELLSECGREFGSACAYQNTVVWGGRRIAKGLAGLVKFYIPYAGSGAVVAAKIYQLRHDFYSHHASLRPD
jgi:hypothetical protein